MARKKGYIFTNKNHPLKGIMAVILGILSIATLVTAVYLSYQQGGISSARYGTAAFLAVIFMMIGMGLSVYSMTEKETFKLFPILGIIINTAAVCILSLILYAGAYVS